MRRGGGEDAGAGWCRWRGAAELVGGGHDAWPGQIAVHGIGSSVLVQRWPSHPSSLRQSNHGRRYEANASDIPSRPARASLLLTIAGRTYAAADMSGIAFTYLAGGPTRYG